jgi:hypothetical protein
MGLNLWNYQIAQELDLDENNVHDIKPSVVLKENMPVTRGWRWLF